jgi:hypothetical protein
MRYAFLCYDSDAVVGAWTSKQEEEVFAKHAPSPSARAASPSSWTDRLPKQGAAAGVLDHRLCVARGRHPDRGPVCESQTDGRDRNSSGSTP